jgi:predicted CXXCH cytochrome family protein
MKRSGLLSAMLALGALATFFCREAACAPAGVVSSSHNLSASGGKGKHGITFAGEQRVCVFCHAPHNTNPAVPLWNRPLPSEATPYKMYGSSTFDAVVTTRSNRPTGASRLCLSCHDGTIALNSYGGSAGASAPVFMPSDVVPTANPNLTSDLSNSHPISFSYSADLAAKAQLKAPAALPPQIKLESGDRLECTACHDAHNNELGNFLVIDNKLPGAPLCTACHLKTGWSDSSHNPSQTPGLESACMNCHYAHSSPGAARLLHSKREVDNCIAATCHSNGAVPVLANLQSVVSQPYRHPVGVYSGQHDENETLPAQRTHVECVDCHNPHQASRLNTPLNAAPAIDGSLRGVAGIDKDSLGVVIASNEYEICFKCHSGANASNFAGITETPPNRLAPETDQNKRFDRFKTSSFHPVTAQRLGDGASLLSNLQSTMLRIYCCDCHSSDQSSKAGGVGPNGPHGSKYEHILMDRYDMPPQPPAVAAPVSDYVSRYGLCFRCHSDSYIMGSSSRFVNSGTSEHLLHVQDRGIPCYACHDPHGVPLNGTLSVTSSRLVNFAKTYAAGPAVPTPSFNPVTRTCVVSCHTAANHSHTYTP